MPLKTGALTATPITAEAAFRSVTELGREHKKTVVLVFSKNAGPADFTSLQQMGIDFVYRIDQHAFVVRLRNSVSAARLRNLSVIAAGELTPALKIGNLLQQALAQKQATELPVSILLDQTTVPGAVLLQLHAAGFRPGSMQFAQQGLLRGTVAAGNINQVAALPFVQFINLAGYEPQPLMFRERGIYGFTALSNGQINGRRLSGSGITVGIGDNADASSHIDNQHRLINRSPALIAASTHGTHVTGVVTGDGIIEERWTGTATGVLAIKDYFDYIISKTSVYRTDYGMTVTNNSYFSGFAGCPGNGEYNELSVLLDEQIHAHSDLMHIFAAGNDGALTCTPYPASFGTVKSGYQTAKNALAIGNVDIFNFPSGGVAASSSRGPVADGRIKPEILASGASVAGTSINNGYTNNTGTSASAPLVTGTWALLAERYKQLHGTNVPSALLKNILVNSAIDRGNPGPDYTHGFGWLQPIRAVELLEQNRYLMATVAQSQTNTHTITIPAGLKQVKVMLYWHDPAGAPYATQALQHDLDLLVTDGSTTYQPWILNPAPGQVNQPAVRGIDRLNNIEQVTIDNPSTSLTIQVTGHSVANGPQAYTLTWDYVEAGIRLIHPLGGERFTTISTAPGRQETITWEANDNSNNTFTLEYSLDNGSSWTVIDNNIPATQFRYFWSVPDVVSHQAKIRITRNGGGASATSPGNFTILGIPTLTAAVPCEGYVNLSWNAVAGATDYEVFQLINGTLTPIATTTQLTYLVKGLNRNLQYWFSVRPRVQDSAGRRGTARSVVPALATPCSDPIFDNDLKIDTLLAPGSGRQFTGSALSNSTTVRVRIKNLDNAATTGSYLVSYQINNGTPVTETVTTGIAAGSTLDYAFNTTADFSATGVYTIAVWVKHPADQQPDNDTLTFTIRHAANAPLTLPHTETFEQTGADEYTNSFFALNQAERFDFTTNSALGRVRTFQNSGMAINGNRSLTLDSRQFTGVLNTNQITATFNLSGYSAADPFRLDFKYRNHGQYKLPDTLLWIRGRDDLPWIPAAQFNTSTALGSVTHAWVNVARLLAAAGQPVSSSFQLRFDQTGFTSANNNVYHPDMPDIEDGFTLDDIRLSLATNDVELVQFLSPDTLMCAPGTATVRIRLRNTTNSTLTNIPVFYRVNGGAPVSGSVASLPANSTADYSFVTPLNLNTPGVYVLDAWTALPGDNFNVNDSLLQYTVYNSARITTFPYLERFEDSNGGYFTTPAYSSWKWGTTEPRSRNVVNRAANGNRGWFTNLSGTYKPNESSWLYSPCFDLSTLTQPVLSFAHISQQENNFDFHTIEYTTDNGQTWQRLGTQNSGTNWFDAPAQIWNTSLPRWHVSSIDIPVNAPSVRFRWLFSSDLLNQFQGIGIDDIHIFEKESIYTGSDVTNLTQPVQGNNWVHFRSGGNLIASIHPQGQNLGNTSVSVYINTGGVRFINNQYYLDRNLVIRSDQPLTDSIRIRFYFTEQEVKNLLDATTCGSCTRFRDAFLAAVTRYSGNPAYENGILNDGEGGTYQFIDSGRVDVIPFNNGYYAEFKVRALSEFWIHATDLGLVQFPVAVTDRNTAGFIEAVGTSGARGELFIKAGAKAGINAMQVRVFNSQGQLVASRQLPYRSCSLQLGVQAVGMYLVEISNPNGKELFRSKVVLQ
ncbi:MAG: S8 family serine peptidase [Lacibacter sp.]